MYNSILALLVIASSMGVLLIYSLSVALKGIKRLHLVLQQLCIVIFLSMQMWICSKHFESYNSIFPNFEKERVKSNVWKSALKHVNQIYVIEFFARGFYNQFFFLSLLNCFDINKMICFPFEYKEYCQLGNQIRRMCLGLVISFALASYKLTYILLQYLLPNENNDGKFDISKRTLIEMVHESLALAVLINYKVICSVVIVKKSLRTRKSLKELAAIGNAQNNSKRESHKRIFYFSLIPLLNNILSFWPDTIERVEPLVEIVHLLKEDFSYNNNNFLILSDDFILITQATVFSFISFSFLVGYLVFFPSIRQKFFCRISKGN